MCIMVPIFNFVSLFSLIKLMSNSTPRVVYVVLFILNANDAKQVVFLKWKFDTCIKLCLEPNKTFTFLALLLFST
jgi:hypothetical protein